MRALLASLFVAFLVAPALSGECEDFLANVIRYESIDAAVNAVSDGPAKSKLISLYDTRVAAVRGYAKAKDVYDAATRNSDAAGTFAALGPMVAAGKAALKAQEDLEAAIAAYCKQKIVTVRDLIAPPDAVLQFVSVLIPPGDAIWTIHDGDAHATERKGTADYAWTVPPQFITADGFTMKLSVDAHPAGKEKYEASIGAYSFPTMFAFDPDPANATVVASSVDLSNAVIVRFVPLMPGPTVNTYYEVHVSLGYGPGVTYLYKKAKRK